jgi:nicotinate-nucleotide pyrophosphorylase (carboxylating)
LKTRWQSPAPEGWRESLRLAVAEDLGPVDLAGALFEQDQTVEWSIEAQEEGVLSGAEIAASLLGAKEDFGFEDGSGISQGDVLLAGTGPASEVLKHERVALNYLMHLSGIATLTWAFVCAAEGTGTRIVDTRKTTPGLRALEKYAVRCGSGHNHRMGLFDGLMIKDNHIAACGGISAAIERAKHVVPHMIRIEVECTSISQVSEAVSAGADVVMLDNMDLGTMRAVVQSFKGQVVLEASGGVKLENVRAIAETGVDLISVGALTHSAPALAIHMVVT